MQKYIKSGEFRTHYLKIMEEVHATNQPVVITRRNIPVATLKPVNKKKEALFGKMKGTIRSKGDLTRPTGADWDANT